MIQFDEHIFQMGGKKTKFSKKIFSDFSMIFLLQSDAFCVNLLLTSLWQSILWEHSLKCRRWQLSLSEHRYFNPLPTLHRIGVSQKIKHGNLQPKKDPVCNVFFDLLTHRWPLFATCGTILDPQASKKSYDSKPQITTLAILRTWPFFGLVSEKRDPFLSSAVSRWTVTSKSVRFFCWRSRLLKEP